MYEDTHKTRIERMRRDIGVNDWEYHQDSRDRAATMGCLCLLSSGILFVVALAVSIIKYLIGVQTGGIF